MQPSKFYKHAVKKPLLSLLMLREKLSTPPGTLGHLTIFAWALIAAVVVSDEKFILVAGINVMVGRLLYSVSLRRFLRWRWLFFFAFLIIPNLIWLGAPGYEFFGIPFSLVGLRNGVIMSLRAVTIILAADAFANSVDVTEIASLVDRLGVKGIGFSLGVAVNMLPTIKQTSYNAWHSLRMRGGFRKKRYQALKLLLVTILANALGRADDIAIAAESRAFSPERIPHLKIVGSVLDRWILVLAIASLIILLVKQ